MLPQVTVKCPTYPHPSQSGCPERSLRSLWWPPLSCSPFPGTVLHLLTPQSPPAPPPPPSAPPPRWAAPPPFWETWRPAPPTGCCCQVWAESWWSYSSVESHLCCVQCLGWQLGTGTPQLLAVSRSDITTILTTNNTDNTTTIIQVGLQPHTSSLTISSPSSCPPPDHLLRLQLSLCPSGRSLSQVWRHEVSTSLVSKNIFKSNTKTTKNVGNLFDKVVFLEIFPNYSLSKSNDLLYFIESMFKI